LEGGGIGLNLLWDTNEVLLFSSAFQGTAGTALYEAASASLKAASESFDAI
jgi:hypothetical protein